MANIITAETTGFAKTNFPFSCKSSKHKIRMMFVYRHLIIFSLQPNTKYNGSTYCDSEFWFSDQKYTDGK